MPRAKKTVVSDPTTLRGIGIKERFGEAIVLARALQQFGLLVVWAPDRWGLHEAYAEDKDQYSLVAEGTNINELSMFVKGAKFSKAHVLMREHPEEA